jgi:putative membrane protein
MAGFLLRSVVTAIALWIAVARVPGLSARDMGALMLAAIVLGLVNATLRPVAVILSFPLTLPTFGLFLLVVNAAMLAIAGWLVPGFTVAGFWPALAGAIVVSLVSAVVGGALARA